MTVNELSQGALTVTMQTGELEALADYLAYASRAGHCDPVAADTMSGFFLTAALVCKTYGIVNLSDTVQAQLDDIVRRVSPADQDEE